MTVAVMKAKRKTRSVGKRGEPGRFVTLKTGRVIFIPEGKRAKWADVKDRVLASKKRKSLEELSRMRPDEITRQATGIETTFIADFGEHGKALVKINEYGSAESEVLAYEFSESIGWGLVPETVMPEGTKDVSLQRWIEGETVNTIFRAGYEAGAIPEFRKDPRMVMMDLLLQNEDRHLGNVLIDHNDRQWAIDNNQAFGAWRDEEGGLKFWYEDIPRLARVAEDRPGLTLAARDVADWYDTPAYREYVGRIRELTTDKVAGQFEENARQVAEWAERGFE